METKEKVSACVMCIFIVFLLCAPLILSFFPSVSGDKLYGVTEAEVPTLTPYQVSSHEYHNKAEQFTRQHIGCSNSWIRLYNELNYRLFHYTMAEKLVLGKDDCFYEEMYITEVLGHNYIGESIINQKVALLKKVQDILWEKYQVRLLLVLEPGKAHFEPECIPDRYHPDNKGITNYQGFVSACQKADVAFLDLNGYFSKLKPSSPHPLYSRYGVHWSSYGLWIAADTSSHFIENQCNINLPDLVWKGGSSSALDKDLDFDMEPSMNLLFPLPAQKLYFPDCQFVYDSTKHQQPRVLTVADSYYWSIYNKGISANLFSHNDFWYYNYAIYPDIWDNIHYIDKEGILENIENQDIILLMMTDANLYDFGWGFLEEVIAAVEPTYEIPKELADANRILHDKNRYAELLKQSRRQKIPFAQMLSKAKVIDNGSFNK